MFRKPLLALTAVLLACAAPLHAQNQAPTENKNDTAGPNRFWQATLGGGHYMVALDRISAISRHKYVLDGAAIVDEVTVDALGQALARFYFISPVTDAMTGTGVGDTTSRLADRARELGEHATDRAGSELQNMVVKKYPETTHARTIEFRLLSEEELTGLYNSVRTAWENNRGRKFTAK